MKHLLFIAVSLVITACSTSPTKEIDWEWQFSGKVYFQNGQSRDSANILWQHAGTLEIIQLSGPLGQGATRLSITPHGATLLQNGEIKAKAIDANTLLAQYIDIPVPVAELRSWLLNTNQQPVTFTSIGWDIQLSKFDSLGRPNKLMATQLDQKLTLLISNWKP